MFGGVLWVKGVPGGSGSNPQPGGLREESSEGKSYKQNRMRHWGMWDPEGTAVAPYQNKTQTKTKKTTNNNKKSNFSGKVRRKGKAGTETVVGNFHFRRDLKAKCSWGRSAAATAEPRFPVPAQILFLHPLPDSGAVLFQLKSSSVCFRGSQCTGPGGKSQDSVGLCP